MISVISVNVWWEMYMTLHGSFIHRSDQTLTLTIGNSIQKLTLQRGCSVRKSTGMWRLTSLCSDKSAMKVKLPGWQNGGLHRLASQWKLCNSMNLSKTCKYSKSLTNTLKTYRKEEECYVTKSEKNSTKKSENLWHLNHDPFLPSIHLYFQLSGMETLLHVRYLRWNGPKS